MTLLLDAEARLFVIPEEPRPDPKPARPREPAGRRTAPPPVPAARALSLASAATPTPVASPGSAASPAPPVTSPAAAPVPERATWAGAGEQGRTLDDVLSASWEGLSTESAAAACPVCDGELVRRWSAGAGVVGGRCRDCGSELS